MPELKGKTRGRPRIFKEKEKKKKKKRKKTGYRHPFFVILSEAKPSRRIFLGTGIRSFDCVRTDVLTPLRMTTTAFRCANSGDDGYYHAEQNSLLNSSFSAASTFSIDAFTPSFSSDVTP